MRNCGRSAIMGLLLLSACADTTAIKKFAAESSDVTSDSSVISGGDAAYKAVTIYFSSPEMINDPTYNRLREGGPGNVEYEEEKTLAPKAAAILEKYMQVLGQLAGDTTVVQAADVTSITGSLKTLKISSPQVQPALDAAGKLGNLIAQGYANLKLRQVVADSNQYVQTLSIFLAGFAKRNADLYAAARNVSAKFWMNRVKDCQAPSKVKFRPPACDAAVALSIRMYILEEGIFKKQADAADAARLAFENIGADHQAIVDSDGKFDAKTLLDKLKADEPALVDAIKDLSKL